MACIGQHPTAEYKYELLAEYAQRYGTRILVETGLYNGHGSGMNIQDRGLFDRYLIVDLQPENCALARERFPSAEVFCGDSAEILPRILAGGIVDRPALFWLDAHGIDDDPDAWPACPIERELAAVSMEVVAMQMPHVALIDDLCMFGRESWQPLKDAPALPQLQAYVDALDCWQREEQDCIMRLTPR